jgi:hypothetical protein
MSFRARQPGCPCCEDDCLIPITGAEGWAVGGGSIVAFSSLDLITVSPGTASLTTFFPEHPEGKSTHVVEVQVKGEDDGDILQVIVTFDLLTQDRLYAEIEVGTTGGYLRLFQVTGGSAFQLGDDVEIDDLEPGKFHTVKVCYDGDVLMAIVNTYHHYARPVTTTGTYVGIATGAITTQATFKDFQWWIHYDDGGYYGEPNDCPRCDLDVDCTFCLDNLVPYWLKIVIAGLTDGTCSCSNQNGTHLIPRYFDALGFPCTWEGPATEDGTCGEGDSDILGAVIYED